MATPVSIKDVLTLTPAERILLVEEIWDSLSSHPEAVELTQAQRDELDARLKAHEQDPSVGSSWQDVKKRIGRSR